MIEQVTVSLPQKLYHRVRQLARTRNQSVDDVLIEALNQTLQIENVLPNSQEDTIHQEMQAYINMHPMLKEKYLGQHVAIFKGQLIDIDDNYEALYKRIDQLYPEKFVWLATVTEEAIPTLEFRSPRLETTT